MERRHGEAEAEGWPQTGLPGVLPSGRRSGAWSIPGPASRRDHAPHRARGHLCGLRPLCVAARCGSHGTRIRCPPRPISRPPASPGPPCPPASHPPTAAPFGFASRPPSPRPHPAEGPGQTPLFRSHSAPLLASLPGTGMGSGRGGASPRLPGKLVWLTLPPPRPPR